MLDEKGEEEEYRWKWTSLEICRVFDCRFGRERNFFGEGGYEGSWTREI